jgi:sugar lactone lactonase YvrE
MSIALTLDASETPWFHAGSPVGAIAVRRDLTLLLATSDAFAVLDPGSGRVETLVALSSEPWVRRANDGKCDPTGRFLVGRMSMDAVPGTGSLVMLDEDLTLHQLLDNLTIPNGLAWRPDGRELYRIDSPRREVTAYAYDLATGALGSSRSVVRFAGAAVPDGMTIDAAGCLWVAMWGGSRVVRVSPDGDILATVHVPASQVSSCTFGGEHLDEIFITTGREGEGMDDSVRDPFGGCLFHVRTGIRGLPPVPFAG